MRIDPEQKIAGFPILAIRQLLRRAKWRSPSIAWGVELVEDALKTSKQEAQSVLTVLKREGYIERRQEPTPTGEWWTTTTKGNQLALATAARPLLRSTAERKLAEFIERVKLVNTSDQFLYKVKKAVVFGSYVTAAERLGDIDVALELVPKIQDREEQQKLEQEKREQAQADGRYFNTFSEELLWPRHEVRLFLKSRARAISLDDMIDPLLKQVETKVIYEDEDIS